MSPNAAMKASISGFPFHGALVPAAQREVGRERQDDEDEYPGAADQEKRGEHARDLELVARLQYPVGEPRLDAAGAGDELRNHRADEREPAADPQAAAEVGERARQAQVPAHLAARGAVELQEVEEVVVGAVETQGRVRDDREERHDPGADEE